jgi:hypothetical protein
MKTLLSAAILALSVTTSASAMNSYVYRCGDVDIKLAIVKDNGRPVGRNVYFRIKLRGDYPTNRGVTRVRPEIEFTEIDDIKRFSIAGKKYECKQVGAGWSDAEDEPEKIERPPVKFYPEVPLQCLKPDGTPEPCESRLTRP